MIQCRRFLAVLVVALPLAAKPLRAEDPAAAKGTPNTTITMFDDPKDPKPLVPADRSPDMDPARLQQLTPTPGSSTSLCAGTSCPSDCPPGMIGYVDYLHWRARPQGLTFASIADPASLVGTPDIVAHDSLDFGNHDGVRAGLGYRFDTGWEVVWNYTYFNSADAQTALASGGGTTALLATNSFFSKQAMDSVQASGNFRLNLHDIEAGWGTCLNDSVDYRTFGSFRWAKIDQDFDQAYSYHLDPATVVNGDIHMPLRMDAAGLRLGAEFHWKAADGLRIFGRLAQSLLVADFETQQIETDTLNGSVLNVHRDDSRIVPVLEAATGIAWCCGPMELSGGYEMSNWFNMIDASRQSQSLFIDGCFVRIALVR